MKKVILGLSLTAVSSLVAATLNIGTGSPTGNYLDMAKDIFSENYCKSSLVEGTNLNILESKGSSDNLRGILNKKYSIGLIQSDVLMSEAKKDPRKVNMNRMKILAGLHLETVHLLLPKSYAPVKNDAKESSNNPFVTMWKSMTKDDKKEKMPKSINIKLEDLKGAKIASWGGSSVSAKAMSYFFGLKWDVVNVKKENRKNITDKPILLVGGMPYKPVEEYLATGNYRLIGLDFKSISAKAPFYMQSEVGYDIDGKTFTAPSVGIQALLVGKSFRKEERNQNMLNISKCIDDNLADLADDPDTNPNWNSVYDLNERNEQINWSYFKI